MDGELSDVPVFPLVGLVGVQTGFVEPQTQPTKPTLPIYLSECFHVDVDSITFYIYILGSLNMAFLNLILPFVEMYQPSDKIFHF